MPLCGLAYGVIFCWVKGLDLLLILRACLLNETFQLLLCKGIVFAAEMAQAYKDQVIKWGIEEIIPIPLHKSRKRKRGYNQAEIIAKCLSEKTGVSLVSDALFRVKKTTAQKKLDRQERMGNLRDAFALSERWKPVANVLLIDDIYTTGATVEQAAKILKKAGAQNVYFLTISIGQGI